MNISNRIQNLRKLKGVSQEELADRIGVSRQSVSKWESEQSVPDIDKIIIMSDYFNVTTDYILKGVEFEKNENVKAIDANLFVIIATTLNFIGLIIASVIWYEEQVATAFVGGFVFMAVGCMVFGIGLIFSTQNIERAKRNFWAINIWILTFIPLSLIYNSLFTGFYAPYPLFGYSWVAFPVFWLIYITICLCMVFIQMKISRRK